MVIERIVAAGGEYGAAPRLLTEPDDRTRPRCTGKSPRDRQRSGSCTPPPIRPTRGSTPAAPVVALTATVSAIGHSYLNQVVAFLALRARHAAEFGIDGVPQSVPRFGYGPLVAPACRRVH